MFRRILRGPLLLKPSPSSTYLGSFYEPEDMSEVDMLLAVGEGAVKKKKKKKPRRGEDFKFREAIVKADFWLLWVVYFVGVGSGVTVLNNLAQIGVSLGVNNTTILLSLFSFCNFLGRLGSGAVSEHFVRTKTLPRTFWMTVTQIIMVLTFLLYALCSYSITRNLLRFPVRGNDSNRFGTLRIETFWRNHQLHVSGKSRWCSLVLG